jgi:hypothetical protein
MPYSLAPLWKLDINSLSEEELWEHFEKCLKAHDWTYDYSDDHGVWRAGEEQTTHLHAVLTIARKYDRERAVNMYNSANPWIDARLLE